jgi:hypothetical protein
MHDLDTIEAINREQLVTATDRLLFRRARLARGSQPGIAVVRRSHAPTVLIHMPARRSGGTAVLAAMVWLIVIFALFA